MTTPIPLLLNPKAGSLHRSGLKCWLDEHRDSFRLVPTSSAGDLTDKARALAEAGAPIVAAAGGDGTLMCAAQGLVGTDASLGILPCGTMNVFAREMGIGSRRFDIALEAMQAGKTQPVDIFTVNGKPFLQMAGFGPDARIVHRVTSKLKKHFGAFSHVITAFRVVIESHPLITVKTAKGEEICGIQVILGNGKRYGGEAMLFANARFDDGKLDAAIIHESTIPILYEVVACMLQRGATQRNSSETTQIRASSSYEITADGKLDYQLDGDYAGTLLPGETAYIEKLPAPLHVCIPLNPVPLTPLGRFMAHPMVEALQMLIKRAKQF
mgnify:CR=1 FL=1